MAKRICYLIDKKVDPQVAAILGNGWPAVKVAALRGLYEQYREEEKERGNNIDELDYDNPELLAQTLSKFSSTLRQVHYVNANKKIKHIERCWDALKYSYSLHDRNRAVSAITTFFSAEVDRLVRNTKVDRQTYINGFKTYYGEYVGGYFSILEGVYEQFLQLRQNWYAQTVEGNYQKAFAAWKQGVAEGTYSKYADMPTSAIEYRAMAQRRYDAFTKALENWNELLPFVLRQLAGTEGVKLGLNKEYTVASSSSFDENSLADKWDISESKREGWQENQDKISAFGSVGKQVRRILATVPVVREVPIYRDDHNGNPVFVGSEVLPERDEFGNYIYMNPVKTHQALEEIIHGAVSSEDMMAKLCSDKEHKTAKRAWLQGIVDVLNSSPQAKTQFFVDMKKNFQPYSEIKITWKNGLSKITTLLLNKSKNILLKKYNVEMSSKGKHPQGMAVWNPKYIFEEGEKGIGGLVNWENLAIVRQDVLAWTEDGAGSMGIFTASLLTEQGKNKRKSWSEKKEFLMRTFASLGFDVSIDTVEAILDSNDIYTVRRELYELFNPDGANTGFTYVLTGAEQRAFKTLNTSKDKEKREQALKTLGSVQYRHLYKRAPNPNFGAPIENHTKKLLTIINKHQDAHTVESRVRYQKNTMFSYVAPSYLGDKLDVIKSFVEANNKEGLLQYLKDRFLRSSFFVSDEYIISDGRQGVIYNMWLSEMVSACQNKSVPLSDSVAAVFSYERDLGSESKQFEDFTSKEHAIDMLAHFWADEEQHKSFGGRNAKDRNKRLTALFPIFTLGDAGVSKYIRAPRITSAVGYDSEGSVVGSADNPSNVSYVKFEFDKAAEEKVLDAFWNVYLQEKRRMSLDRATAHVMYANGKPVEKAISSFSVLTFLNPDDPEYCSKYHISSEDAHKKDKVKEVIKSYLEDAAINGITTENGTKIPSFKKRLEELGVLETKEITVYERGKKTGKKKVYKNISSLANPQNIDSKIREFFYNTKLATIQQLQIMTIDPSFYHGTKDLQKRYKEIHAPGNILDVKAVDFDGNLYSEDGIERAVYFEDISTNTEVLDPAFMETILRLYAIKDKETVDRAIQNGILKPLSGPKEDKRQDMLKELLGEQNYNIYKQYTDNSLTDGQGYRTLKSYRKVMGMAGRWTMDMENAYKAITNIAAKHTDGSSLTKKELETISKLAVIFQPIKPYMFTHEKYPVTITKTDEQNNPVKDVYGNPITIDTYKLISVQHKYAEALIIPELLPNGNKLKDLAEWMDENNVDVGCSTKVVKVGCFGQADFTYKIDNTGQLLDDTGNVIMYDGKPLTIRTKIWKNLTDKDGNKLAVKLSQDKKGLKEALTRATVHQLSYQDYRIQTNVPEHINGSQLFGTQLRKLIMSGIDLSAIMLGYLPTDSINLDTGDGNNKRCPLTGRNILALFNSIICANIWESFEKVVNNVSDIESLSDILKQTTVGAVREAMDNLFSYVVTGEEKENKKFFMPLFEGGLEHDTAALILSAFKKIVNKQQIMGGSAVQVSAFGLKGYEEDGGLRFVQDPGNKDNILYAECEMPFSEYFTVVSKTKNGKTKKQKVKIDFNKYCFTEGEHYGELMPSGKPLSKDNPEYKKYLSYTYKEVNGELVPCKFSDPQAKVYKPAIEAEYPDILNIVAYRIPTEREYSMLNLKIKRFTSKVAGGTLKVPPQGTTIAGFDFDIDKLYFFKKEFVFQQNIETFKEEYFSESQASSIWYTFYQDNIEIRNALEQKRAEAEAANPDLYHERILPSGRSLTIHHTTLNSYWETAKIEERFGVNKAECFSLTAQSLGYYPVVNGKEVKKTLISEYDFYKSPEDNNRAARNNLLISLIQARLSDPKTAKNRYTPGGFVKASRAARLMRELLYGNIEDCIDNGVVDWKALEHKLDSADDPEPEFNSSDPYTIITYNQQNQVAGKLIGIFANQNTHSAFCAAMEVFALKKSISFCGKSYSDLLHKNDGQAFDVGINMAEYLAASVDAVKDPVLNYLNLNTITADAGALLVRLGYNTKEVGLLFNQPIIIKVCQEALNSNRSNTAALSDAIAKAQVDLQEALTEYDKKTEVTLTADRLVMSIVKDRKLKEQGGSNTDFIKHDAVTQKAALNLFSTIMEAATDVSAFVLNTKFTAANAVKSTLGGLYAQQLKVDDYLDSYRQTKDGLETKMCKIVVSSQQKQTGLFALPIDNNGVFLDYSKKQCLNAVRFNPFAYEQLMFDCNRKMTRILAKYYPYETPVYKQIRAALQDLAMYGSLTEDEINDIHSEIIVAALAKQTDSLFNGEAAYVLDGEATNITNREYYREHFAAHLSDMLSKYPELQNFDIFKYICPDLVQKESTNDLGLPVITDHYRLTMQDVGGLDSETKEAIREAWTALMQTNEYGIPENEDFFNLGRDLFMYCYYQMGFTFSPISFMHLAPTQVKDFIAVPRSYDLEINTFDAVHPNGDDVFVFSKADEEACAESEAYGASPNNPKTVNSLYHEAFCWPETLTPNDVRSLIQEAISHPELHFKIAKELTEEELSLFGQNISGYSVPANILFTENTKEKMSFKLQNAMHYGRTRSYRQFLYEVLEGKNVGMETNDFAQQFILNHLDNSKYVLSVDQNPKVKEIVRKQLINDNSLNTTLGYRNAITIDVSTFMDKEEYKQAIQRIVRIESINGEISAATWIPVLKIGDVYYMADNSSCSNDVDNRQRLFAQNSSLTMVYRKVVPLGSKSEMSYDNGTVLPVSMAYKTMIDAQESVGNKKFTLGENEEISDGKTMEVTEDKNSPVEKVKGGNDGNVLFRQKLEKQILTEFRNAYAAQGVEMDIQGAADSLSKASDNEILEAVASIMAAERINGVIVLDEDGNPKKAC